MGGAPKGDLRHVSRLRLTRAMKRRRRSHRKHNRQRLAAHRRRLGAIAYLQGPALCTYRPIVGLFDSLNASETELPNG